MNNCIICLEINCDISSRINILSKEWIEGNIQRIIEKHLWWWYIKPVSSANNCDIRWICGQCWQQISSFHNFYCKVESVHRHYQQMQTLSHQIEINNEDKQRIVNKYCIENTVVSPPITSALSKEKRMRRPKKKSGINNEKSEIVNNVELENYNEFKNNETLIFNSLDMLDMVDLDDDYRDWDSEEDKPLKTRVQKLKSLKTKRKSNIMISAERMQKKLKQSKSVNQQKNVTHGQIDKLEDFFKESQHKLECCICYVPLVDFRTLKMHYRNKHNTQGYAMCCGKKYFKRCLLVDHLQVHRDPNYFKCQSCTKTFATRRGLEMHVETHKLRERTYNCDECGKSYFKLHIFERHKLTHVPESEKNFICTQCDKKFASEYLRRQHEHSTHAKKYAKVCDICGKTFLHSYSFLRHMDEHTGAPPSFETCDICGVKLTNKYGLKQHMKMRHIEENLQEQICPYCSRVSPNLNAHRMHVKYTHTMQRKHACNLCDKAFRRPLELKEHLSTHTGEALYTCPHCPRTFISNANMHKHRKIAHHKEWEETRLKKLHESGKKNATASVMKPDDVSTETIRGNTENILDSLEESIKEEGGINFLE